MSALCTHCHTARPANSRVPGWQCPSCGKAYVKESSSAAPRLSASPIYSVSSARVSTPWGKLLTGLAIAYGACVGLYQVGGTGADGISRDSHFGSNPSVEQLSQLAARRQVSDVQMYSAAWCPNCTAAKGWMGQYGFKYEECDIDKDSACASQLKALDPQAGVPYLIVRGQHMKDGFDSEQFVAALAK